MQTMNEETRQKLVGRLTQGALNYSLANKSDPFAYSRAMSHIKNGLCTDSATYEAQASSETRVLDAGMVFSDGSNTYAVTVWRDVKRP